MRNMNKRLVCALLVCALLLGCVTGCAPQDDPRDAVVTGEVSPESIAVARGENRLTLRGDTVFSEDIVEHPEAVSVSYGWGECHPEKILRPSDNTLEIYFLAEDAPQAADGDEAMRYTGYLLVSEEYVQKGNAVEAAFCISQPALTTSDTAARGALTTRLELELENARFAEEIQPGDILLSKAFEGLAVAAVRRVSESRMALTLCGEVKSESAWLVPYTQGGIAVRPGSTNAAATAYGEVEIAAATAYLGGTPAFSGESSLRVCVRLENCSWSDGVSASGITLSGAFAGAAIEKVEKCGADAMDVILAIDKRDCDGVGSILFADDCTDAGQPVGVDVNFDNIGFYASVDSLEKTAEQRILTIEAVAHGLRLNRTLSPEEPVLAGEFAQGRVKAVEQAADGRALKIVIAFPAAAFDALDGYEGTIALPAGCVESEYASVEAADAIVCVGAFKELPRTAAVAEHTGEEGVLLLSAGQGLAQTTGEGFGDSLCAFITDGLARLARTGLGKAGNILSGKLMQWLGLEQEDEANKKLDQVIDHLNSLTTQIGQLEQTINKLIDAVETSAFKEQMRDIQASVLKLKARTCGYQAALSEVSKLEAGSEPYQRELKILVDKINNTSGLDFHGETYALGEKLLSDAAGTADGAIKAHYDRVSTIHDWEQQTYDERERFYLYSLGMYLQSAMLDSIALGHVSETADSAVERSEAKSNLEQLKAQIARVSAVAEKYRVKRLRAEYDRNLRTGVILSTKVERVTFDRDHRMVSQAETYRLMQQKLLDDTLPGQHTSLRGSANFTLPESLGLLSEKQALDIMKYSDKQSLVEELRSAGFRIPADCPDSVVVRDVRIRKDGVRSGTSAKRFGFYTYYKLVAKTSSEAIFSTMWFYGHYFVHAPNPLDTDTDYGKAQKYQEQTWATYTIVAASVRLAPASQDLYIH